MRHLETPVEWLRPFVESKAWDYCVVWKLGDDPSRFIEWMGCCCSGGGGNYGNVNVKEEREVQVPLCRDAHFKHPVRSNACEALALLPSFMPLYSGIHGEVVTANKPRWLSNTHASDSTQSPESIGTRVFVPVFGGLIELFAAKHISEDQKFLELIIAHCNFSVEQVLSAGSYANLDLNESFDPLLEENLQTYPPSLHSLTFIPRIQVLPQVTQYSTHLSNEGSSNIYNISNENPLFDSSYGYGYAPLNGPLQQSIRKSSTCKIAKKDNTVLKEQTGLVLSCDKKAPRKPEKEHCHSKNLITERKRRNKIKDGLFTLRALVPKISKMDRAAILGDAIEYIKELQQEKKKLQAELKEIEEPDCKKENAEIKQSNLDELHEGTTNMSPTEHNKNTPSCGENEKTEVQIEVNHISKRDFLIKLFCDQKQGGFARLMKAINFLDLQVVDANVTTFNGKVLNILRVEVRLIAMNRIRPVRRILH
ncbi:transcription factor bHLH90 isoform X2 [Mangifera indica]|uniref:transcription factor bHLH90 isoform X2 n=1 Tax=Mangifera indica TaxID=29780 RepID=UPI001CFA0092|nr:transcription factor bHLH90 isoform X2 [Mangifera indica]